MDTYQPQQQQDERTTLPRRSGFEALLFLIACVVGIYGLGQGLTGLMTTGQVINLGWLAVAGVAFYVLSAQMARVHDSWPHRPKESRSPRRSQTESKQELPGSAESR
jgi:hypothetical protein